MNKKTDLAKQALDALSREELKTLIKEYGKKLEIPFEREKGSLGIVRFLMESYGMDPDSKNKGPDYEKDVLMEKIFKLEKCIVQIADLTLCNYKQSTELGPSKRSYITCNKYIETAYLLEYKELIDSILRLIDEHAEYCPEHANIELEEE